MAQDPQLIIYIRQTAFSQSPHSLWGQIRLPVWPPMTSAHQSRRARWQWHHLGLPQSVPSDDSRKHPSANHKLDGGMG
ncbi:hypothetical protein SRHO_G00121360 [Serrasalmus rhombeus]